MVFLVGIGLARLKRVEKEWKSESVNRLVAKEGFQLSFARKLRTNEIEAYII